MDDFNPNEFLLLPFSPLLFSFKNSFPFWFVASSGWAATLSLSLSPTTTTHLARHLSLPFVLPNIKKTTT
jgi:hypothetical protein